MKNILCLCTSVQPQSPARMPTNLHLGTSTTSNTNVGVYIGLQQSTLYRPNTFSVDQGTAGVNTLLYQ